MRVCHCHGVTDRAIRRCVQEGAVTPRAVGRTCGAGTSCGGCRPLIEKVVRREVQRFERSNEAGTVPHLVFVAG